MRDHQTANVRIEPSPDEVQEQMKRILASPEFILPDRGRRFLEFIISEAVAGRGSRLKAFTIAQEVFGRGVDFDSPNDPCVRIAAAQLRRALERYYLTAGSSDELVISIPSGGYAPSMTLRETRPGADEAAMQAPESPKRESRVLRWIMIGAGVIVLVAVMLASFSERDNPAFQEPVTTAGTPTIVVEKFTTNGESRLSDDVLTFLRDDIVVNLASSKAIVVLDGSGKFAEGEPTYRLQGSVHLEGDDLRSVSRLVRQVDGVVALSSNYNVNIRGRSMLDVESAIARSLAAALSSPFEMGPLSRRVDPINDGQ
ncbi:hypothetical protein [Rhizobium sp. Root1220]|uniref:hypothetical protein n=1 Tax=Rhizobium sp. Root1220 TaxID=1736432 RepID=UPI0006F41A87|nr:hypothetical protein [Rhizobium sp. Root1220]KQV78170.1 hypothetical protein ASC90_26970 [Rhizobium sp. Root1220]